MIRSLYLSSIVLLSLTAYGGGISISDVQGSGPESTMVGETVTVEGIVTGDFQDNDADDSGDLGGFFLQAERADSDASTSDGVFVFDGRKAATDVTVGDKVAVTGLVKEFFGETQIAASSAASPEFSIGSVSATAETAATWAILGFFIMSLRSLQSHLVRCAASSYGGSCCPTPTPYGSHGPVLSSRVSPAHFDQYSGGRPRQLRLRHGRPRRALSSEHNVQTRDDDQ